MPQDAASFAFLIATARALLAQVLGRDRLDRISGGERWYLLRPAALKRLSAGLRVLASFVRRLLLLMALSMEHDLVDRVDPDQPLPRPGHRKRASLPGFVVLEPPFRGATPVYEAPKLWIETIGENSEARQSRPQSQQRLLRQLDLLAAIMANPERRAHHLAWHLARRRPGVLLPPRGPTRIAGCWGSEVRASHDAMAGAILSAGRVRPPPLPPPRRGWPTVTVIAS